MSEAWRETYDSWKLATPWDDLPEPAHEWSPRYKDGDGGLCAVCDRDCREDAA